MPDSTVSVRYIVNDVDAALDFYTTHLGFEAMMSAAPAFADIKRGNLRLLLSGPASSAGRTLPDGRQPVPGGWNRIHFIVDDIGTEVGEVPGAVRAGDHCAEVEHAQPGERWPRGRASRRHRHGVHAPSSAHASTTSPVGPA